MDWCAGWHPHGDQDVIALKSIPQRYWSRSVSDAPFAADAPTVERNRAGWWSHRDLPPLAAVFEDSNPDLPLLAREICRELLDRDVHLTGRTNAIKKRIDAITREGETSRRLQIMPGVSPISVSAVLTPPSC
jgi:transposase